MKYRIQKHKKSLIIILGLLIVFAVVVAVFISGKSLMKVNGQAVTKQEYSFFEQRCKTNVISYYYSKYKMDLTIQPELWNKKIDDITPKEYLKEVTVKEITRFHCIQQLAAQSDLNSPSDFNQMQKQWKTNNAKREKTKAESGSTVYGPVTLDFLQYFTYRYGDIEKQIINQLSKTYFKFSDQELEAHFNTMDKTLIKSKLTSSIDLYLAESTVANQDAIDETLKEIEKALLQSSNVDIAMIIAKHGINIEYVPLQINTDAISKEDVLQQQISQELVGSTVGQVSKGVFDGSNGIYIVKSITDYTDYSFEANKLNVASDLLMKSYNLYIESLVADAKIE